MPIPSNVAWIGVLCAVLFAGRSFKDRRALRAAQLELKALKQGSSPPREEQKSSVAEEEDAKKCLQAAVRGALISGLVYVGDKVGLYKYLHSQPKNVFVTAKQIAKELQLNERWVKEWLRQQAGAKILTLKQTTTTTAISVQQSQGNAIKKEETDGKEEEEEKYCLSPGYGVVLTETANINGYAMYQCLPPLFRAFEQLPHCFQKGGGLTYSSHGKDVSEGIARQHLPFFQNFLCQQVLAHVVAPVSNDEKSEVLSDLLRQGIVCADVGCGAGGSLIAMAKQFPASTFHGFELCKVAIETANEAIAKAGLADRVFMHDCKTESMRSVAGTQGFDFVLAFDSLHDMAEPLVVLRQISESLSSKGVLLVGDIKCFESTRENFLKLGNDSCAYYYGFSCAMCLPSGLSEPAGLGLGTMGLTPSILTQLALAGGFSTVTHCNSLADWVHQNNNWFVVSK